METKRFGATGHSPQQGSIGVGSLTDEDLGFHELLRKAGGRRDDPCGNPLEKSTFKVYLKMAIKRKPHHDLAAVKAKFAQVKTLEITRSAVEGARALGYSLEDVVEAVQELEPGDFIKSETAHSPPNSKVWHDTYNMPWDGRWLYLKFAGETLIDVTLTSFKEVGND